MGFFTGLFKKNNNNSVTVSTSYTVIDHPESTRVDFDIPPIQGDYAKTIFLWVNSRTAPVKEDDGYQRYLLYECGIRNPAEYHRQLIAEGYFSEATLEQILNTLRVAELKEILAELTLDVKGKKGELVARVAQSASTDVIVRYCPEKLYVLSQKGQDFLENHDEYVRLHQHKDWGIDWKEYDAIKMPGKSFYDNAWAIFNKRLARGASNFGRSEYLHMYQLLKEEGRRSAALQMLLRVVYIDFSGIGGAHAYSMFRKGVYKEKDVREFFDGAITVAPGLINAIKEFEDVYDDAFVDKIYEQKLPVNVCDKELFLSIVHSLFDGSYDEQAVSDKLRRAYYKYLREHIFK